MNEEDGPVVALLRALDINPDGALEHPGPRLAMQRDLSTPEQRAERAAREQADLQRATRLERLTRERFRKRRLASGGVG